MADAILRDDYEGEAIRKEFDNETLAAYLRNRHGMVPETREERLRLASGITEIRETLSRVIDAGMGCNQLSQFTYDMFAQISATSISTKHECTTLREDLHRMLDGQYENITQSIEEELEKVEGVQFKFAGSVEDANAQLDERSKKSLSSLERDLAHLVSMFIADQRTILEGKLLGSEPLDQKSYEIDLTGLHADMEETLSKRYGSTRRAIDVILEECMLYCEDVMQEGFDDEVENLTIEDLPNDTFVTTLSMSKKTLQADIINEKSWQFWRRKTVAAKETLTAMCKLAGEELRPTLAKLLEVFDEAQTERIQAGISRIGIMQRMLEGLLTERRRALQDSKTMLDETSSDPSKRDAFIEQLQTKIDLLETRLQELDALNLTMSEAPILEAA